MPSPRLKRGARDRQLDPVLDRAIVQLNARMKDKADRITQPELARRSGVDQSVISRVLDGQRPEASFYIVVRLLQAAGLSVDWVVQEPPAARNDVRPWPVSARGK